MKARYDLLERINSHDFYQWLFVANHMGMKEVVFGLHHSWRRSLWPEDETLERYRSIVRPGPELFGFKCSEGDDGETIASEKLQDTIRYARTHKKLKKLVPVVQPGSARYTVTLRQQCRVHLHRNSTVSAWLSFARKIGAIVLMDYIVQPIPLKDRFALYAGAEMNFGVDNGPMTVLTMTALPCMVFKYRGNVQYLSKCGLIEPQQFPWCGPNQMMFWEDDTEENIWRRFEWWRNAVKAA
jgi:hypothetical protein